jgi:tetratricopeptide (TPR) repeat protein
MVHMPSHIYIRTGQYDKGRLVNISAVKNYYGYRKLFPDVSISAFLYEYHNLHMQATSSMNMSDYSIAIRDAKDCRKSIDTTYLSGEAPFSDYVQYIYMTPLFTMITFQQWRDILDESLTPYGQHYGRLIQEFARGMAFAHMGYPDKAKTCLALMDSVLKEKDMMIVLSPFNAPVTGGTVAKYILMGTIAEKENNMTAAIQYYAIGVATEDSLVYQEPRDWLVPARHYLGRALLKEKKYADAEKVFLKDLEFQPNNYISTTGLAIAKRQK